MANKIHIDNWISRAEPDYYTMFIKAYIPLNIWCYTEFNTKQDKEAIDKLISTSNKIRNRIVSLLNGNDIDSKEFKRNLAYLHEELRKRTILNYNKPVSFEKHILPDYFPEPCTVHDNGIVYKGIPSKSTGYKIIATTIDNSKTYIDKTFNPYDYDKLLLENQFIALTKNMQDIVKKVFQDISPMKPISIISKSKSKSDFIMLDSDLKIKVIKDFDLIAKVLIQVLYSLRCILFHGELEPTNKNMPIYKYAYNLLYPLINELN